MSESVTPPTAAMTYRLLRALANGAHACAENVRGEIERIMLAIERDTMAWSLPDATDADRGLMVLCGHAVLYCLQEAGVCGPVERAISRAVRHRASRVLRSTLAVPRDADVGWFLTAIAHPEDFKTEDYVSSSVGLLLVALMIE
jgi:hypothetical protein